MAIKHLSPKTPEEIRQIKIDYLAGVAQSILDNGFMTVAYNWHHTAHKNWRYLFHQLGINSEDRFFWNLEQLFNTKDDYEYFDSPAVRDDNGKREDCWEEMAEYAGKLQEDLTPELTQKLKDVANKNYNFIFK